MPPSRRTQQRFQSLDGICRIVLFAPPGTFYIPDAAVSMVMRHGYHPYAIEYAETHPLMRTVRSGEDVNWDNLVVFELEPEAPDAWEHLQHVLNLPPRPGRVRRLPTLVIELALAVTRRLRNR